MPVFVQKIFIIAVNTMINHSGFTLFSTTVAEMRDITVITAVKSARKIYPERLFVRKIITI